MSRRGSRPGRRSRPWPWLIVAVPLAALTVAGWLWWSVVGGIPVVDLDSPPVRGPGPGSPVSSLAVAPLVAPDQPRHAHVGFVDYLSRRLGRPIHVVQRQTYAEYLELLRHGLLDLAILCPGAYLHALGDGVGLQVIAIPVYPQDGATQSLVIVQARSSYQTVEDLRGRSFAFTDPLSLTGHYYPVARLLAGDGPSRAFFSKSLFTYSHAGSLRAVREGIVDAAAISSRTLERELRGDPALAKELRIIDRSPPLGNRPVVVPATIPDGLRDALRATLLAMAGDKAGRRVLDALSVERFAEPPDGLYESAAEIVARARDYLDRNP